MINTKLIELALKKQGLKLASAMQRLDFKRHSSAFSPVFSVLDKACRAGPWIKSHPQWVAVGGIVLVLIRRKIDISRSKRWVSKGVAVWQTVCRWKTILKN